MFHLRGAPAPEPFERSIRPPAPTRQFSRDCLLHRFTGKQSPPQGRALQCPCADVEAEAHERISLPGAQSYTLKQPLHGSLGDGNIRQQPGLRLGLADAQARAHIRAGVAVTDCPGLSAAGGIGIGLKPTAFPVADQLQAF
jgi:hypothetical protein